MSKNWTRVKNEKELSNETGRHRDYKYYQRGGSCTSKQIDKMVDRLGEIVTQLQNQQAATDLANFERERRGLSPVS